MDDTALAGKVDMRRLTARSKQIQIILSLTDKKEERERERETSQDQF